MKVVLRQDVPKLGEAGEIKEVSGGYGRNFLIPQGLAILATPGEVKVAEHNAAVRARKIAKQEEALRSLAERIEGSRLEFTAKVGDHGRLYGSVTAQDVADALAAKVGEEVDRRKIQLAEPLRSVGEHDVAVHLVGRLRPRIVVVIHGEGDEAEAVAEAEAVVAEAEDAAEA